jgi:hypothetical protein
VNELFSDLASIASELPSPAYLVGSSLFGIIGFLAFRRGRKLAKPNLIWTGAALMVGPYAVPETWLLWLTGIVLSGWLYLKWD